jgi:carbamoyltransferase
VRLTGLDRIALAGGVVSNIRATRRIRVMPEVKAVYVFPHMGDGGLALGAAVAAASAAGEHVNVDLSRLDLGPSYTPPAMAAAIRAAGFRADAVDGIGSRVADRLADGRVVMWFQGRMDTGPERSVIAACSRGRTGPTFAIA